MRTIGLTGSASGIGAALRKRLEADGDTVIGVDLRNAEITADLSTPAGRAAAIEGLQEASGGALDGLALFAGVGPQVAPALQATVNFFGAITVLDGLRPTLAAGDDAAVVVASSVSAVMAPVEQPLVDALLVGEEERAAALVSDGGLGYASSKLALARAIRARAPEWIADGIRLNAIAPGMAHTPLTQ